MGERHRRHVGVGDRLEHHRPVGGEGLIPGPREILGSFDTDTFQTEKLRVAGVREVGQQL